jgi:replicative DNA helicase
VEAEQSVLGGLLLDNRAWDRADDLLTDADFYRPEHRLIYAAMAGMINTNKPADVITVFEHLQGLGQAQDCGGLAYLNALAQSVPSAANMRRYAEIVCERAVLRALIGVADEAATAAFNPQGRSAADILGDLGAAVGKLDRRQFRNAPRLMADIALGRLDYYTALEEGTAIAGWPTHIPRLDAALNGGLRAGGLYVLAARPAVGKTSFAQHLAQALAASELPTLFCSMEMGEAEIADRGVASTGRLSYSALQTGRMSKEDWSRAADAMEGLARLPIYVDDQPALTLRDVRFKARSIKGLKVLVIDYLQLMTGTGQKRDTNRNAEIEEISRGLKALAKELGIAVLALSQLNRAVEQRAVKRPTLSDLRDSGAIEQDADVVMFLWPVRELSSEGRKIVGLGIDKNRQGRTDEFGLDFFGDTQRWGESTADIRPPLPNRKDDL